MNAVAANGRLLARPHALPVQAYVKVAGVLASTALIRWGRLRRGVRPVEAYRRH